MNEHQYENYRRLCASHSDDHMIKAPPRSQFDSATLKVVVEYHAQLRLGGEYDPTFFLVCTDPDSFSVLVVTLDDEDREPKPDMLWERADHSGALLTNLQNKNLKWSDVQELPVVNDEGQPSTSHIQGTDEQVSYGAVTPQHTLYGARPPLGFHIQVYMVPGVNDAKLLLDLEPESHRKKHDRSDWVCKPYRLPEEAGRDPASHAASMHAERCSHHPTLHPQFFIVGDELNFEDEGVLVVNLDQTEQQHGSQAGFQTQRAEAIDTAIRAAVRTICLVAKGHQQWKPEVTQIAIYYANVSDADLDLARAIDPQWTKRRHGEHRIALGGSMVPKEIEKGDGFWPALIRRHIAYCRRQRFEPAFTRQYFIYCGTEKPSESTEVQLVQLDWNGDVRLVDELVNGRFTKVTIFDVLASDAHKVCSEVLEGKATWQGKTLSK
jgi:hypothetical protein